jgi:hypothetical protein
LPGLPSLSSICELCPQSRLAQQLGAKAVVVCQTEDVWPYVMGDEAKAGGDIVSYLFLAPVLLLLTTSLSCVADGAVLDGVAKGRNSD